MENDKKFKPINIIDNEIKHHNKLHPLNDKFLNNLKNKELFIQTLIKDLGNQEKYNDLSNGKNNLYSFNLKNNSFNIFIEHCDGGGRDVSFNKPDRKIAIPFHTKAFKDLIKEMKNLLVMDLYFELNSNGNDLKVNFDKYCYLIVIPSEIYTSKVTYNILSNSGEKANSSSRWVKMSDIKKCIDTKSTLINDEENVWIVHPDNIKHFLEKIVLDDYKNQFKKSYLKLLDYMYNPDSLNSERQNEILNIRSKLREKLLSRKKCEILSCGVNIPSCLVASHIWPVNNILIDKTINWDAKKEYIGDENNAFLLCGLHDKLLDKFLITFDDNGKVIPSKLIKDCLDQYSLGNINNKVINVNKLNKFYLSKHRVLFNEAERNRVLIN